MRQQTIGGVDLQYYSLCKRKLWLYRKGIGMEDESDRVMQGKVLHETAYPRIEKKEILIGDAFKLDSIDGEYIREVKISSRMRLSDEMQMLFYLYQMSLRGVEKKGLISYTKEKKTVEVLLTEDSRKNIQQAIAEAYDIINKTTPPKIKKVPYCKSCAYFGFCYAVEVDES